MTAADIQKEIADAMTGLEGTTSSGSQMVAKYGPDSTKWPATSKWGIGFAKLRKAITDIAALTTIWAVSVSSTTIHVGSILKFTVASR